MDWFFVIVTWFGLAGLMRQEIPVDGEVACNASRDRTEAEFDAAMQDGFGYTISDECQFRLVVEKAK